MALLRSYYAIVDLARQMAIRGYFCTHLRPLRHLRASGILLTLLIIAPATAASPIALLDYSLRDLKTSQLSVDLRQFKGTPVLMVLFEPNCDWCFKQIKAINRLQDHCPHAFQPLAIGVNSNPVRLRREAQRLRARFPALQASAEMLHDLGTLPGTPLLLLSDATGAYSAHHRGYQAIPKLSRLLAEQNIHCSYASANASNPVLNHVLLVQEPA